MKILKEYVLPVTISVIILFALLWGIEKLGMIPDFLRPNTERVPVQRVQDTQEYRALDSAYNEQGRKLSFWQGYGEGLSEYFDKLQAQKLQEPVILKKKEQEYQKRPESEKETEFWKKYNETWGK